MDALLPLVLVLATCLAIILIVVVGVIYSEKKESSLHADESRKLMQLLTEGKISEKTYEELRMKLEKEITYRKELDSLSSLLAVKKIDQGTYQHMREQLQQKYQKD